MYKYISLSKYNAPNITIYIIYAYIYSVNSFNFFNFFM